MARRGEDSWMIRPLSLNKDSPNSESELKMSISKHESPDYGEGKIRVEITDADNDTAITYITPQTALQIVRDMLEIIAYCRDGGRSDGC